MIFIYAKQLLKPVFIKQIGYSSVFPLIFKLQEILFILFVLITVACDMDDFGSLLHHVFKNNVVNRFLKYFEFLPGVL